MSRPKSPSRKLAQTTLVSFACVFVATLMGAALGYPSAEIVAVAISIIWAYVVLWRIFPDWSWEDSDYPGQ